MRRVVISGLMAVGAIAALAAPAGAITGGVLDGNQHPNVAMIVFYQPDGRFRCSATLVSPTVLVKERAMAGKWAIASTLTRRRHD